MIKPPNETIIKLADESFVMLEQVEAVQSHHPTLDEHIDDLTVSAIQTAFAVTEVIHGTMEAGSGLKDTAEGLAKTTGKAVATGAHYVAEKTVHAASAAATKTHDAVHNAAGNAAEGVGYAVGRLHDPIDRFNEIVVDQKDLVVANLQSRCHNDPQILSAVKAQIQTHQHPESGKFISAVGKATGTIEAVVEHAKEHIVEVADHISDNLSARFATGVAKGAAAQPPTTILWAAASTSMPAVAQVEVNLAITPQDAQAKVPGSPRAV